MISKCNELKAEIDVTFINIADNLKIEMKEGLSY